MPERRGTLRRRSSHTRRSTETDVLNRRRVRMMRRPCPRRRSQLWRRGLFKSYDTDHHPSYSWVTHGMFGATRAARHSLPTA